MQFKRLNRDTGERIFMVMQANEANIAADDVVQLEFAAASVDGVKIQQPEAGGLTGVVGVADAAIANGAFGLVQVYGYRSTCRIQTTGTVYFTGQVLCPVAGADYLSSGSTVPVGYAAQFVLLQSLDTGTATISAKIFIKCM